jgi:hypothetical protein
MAKVAPLIGVLAVAGIGYAIYSDDSTAGGNQLPSQTNQNQTSPQNPNGIPSQTEPKEDLKPDVEWFKAKDYSFKDYMGIGSVNVPEEENPFEQRTLVGKTDWRSSNKVELMDSDRYLSLGGYISGGIKLKVKNNWRVQIKVKTNNWNFFNNDVYVAKGTTGANRQEPNTNGQSLYEWVRSSSNPMKSDSSAPNHETFVVWLDGAYDDYISIDIDSEHGGIDAFALRTQGQQFAQQGVIDSPTKVSLKQVEKKNPNYDPQRFGSEVFNATGGLIGLGGRLFKGLGKGFGAVADAFRLRRVGGATADVIAGTTKVGDTITTPAGNVQTIDKVEGIITKADVGDASKLENIDGVVRANNDGTRIKVGTNHQALNKSGNLIRKDGGGFVNVQEGMIIVKVSSGGASVGSSGAGFGATVGGIMSSPAVKNFPVWKTFTVGAGAIGLYGLYQIVSILPDTIGDGIKKFTEETLGINCSEKCAENPNSYGTGADINTCIEACQGEANERLAIVGGIGIVGILGLALIFRRNKTSKEAEYIILR